MVPTGAAAVADLLHRSPRQWQQPGVAESACPGFVGPLTGESSCQVVGRPVRIVGVDRVLGEVVGEARTQRRRPTNNPPMPAMASHLLPDVELVSDTWTKADVEVTQHFWRRPLAAVMAEFAAAGFVIDAITEARPSAEAVRRFAAVTVSR